jgi:hypothetical protein
MLPEICYNQDFSADGCESVTWSNSNADIDVVDGYYVAPSQPGTDTVTATCDDGTEAAATITITSSTDDTVDTDPNIPTCSGLEGMSKEIFIGSHKPENSDRLYPLVVVLHNGNIFDEAIRQEYPAFYYEAGDTVEKGQELAEKIRRLISEKGYRIDLNRIFACGWSQGG